IFLTGGFAEGLPPRRRAAPGIAIIHIRHESLRPEALAFKPGTGGMEFHPAVAPKEGERVITKHERSCAAAITEEIHRESLRELEAIVQGTLRAEEAVQALKAHEDL
ncbi:MAG: isochorismatase family protein, partial [Deltaproteobacteria bacterium]|nr:isochorismatase family protein [Candidatus Zymogenaceae bacterium]